MSATKFKSPGSFEISFDIRKRFFLVVSCNFNPFNFIDFAEINLISIEGVAELQVIDKYDDGTGYYIFRLKSDYNRDTVVQGISDQFQEYFWGDTSFKLNF